MNRVFLMLFTDASFQTLNCGFQSVGRIIFMDDFRAALRESAYGINDRL